MAGFPAERQEDQALAMKESWEVVAKDIPRYSFLFFTTVLEIAPAAKQMFPFLRDSEVTPQNNPKLKAHAVKVFKMTCESAVRVWEKGEVVVKDMTLKYLGSLHRKNGVTDPHFQVLREALLRTLKEAIGDEKWSQELEAAWGEAYDQLAAAIRVEMK
ncbi:unnamed protein product [Linum trigynum]|uniref:Globin domain-containing protein n=1 Tax=Linum trigynum TaxID=586398 RepID=A0AAV2CQF8_9ROSI